MTLMGLGTPADAQPAESFTNAPSPPRPVWLVFARRRYDESLYQVGTVTAEDEAMASMYAQSIYDEHPWIEMMILPRSSTRTVVAA